MIKFDKRTVSLGRNGYLITTGICLLYGSRIDENNKAFDTVGITPITSRGEHGRCFIDIPKENITELIKELEKFL